MQTVILPQLASITEQTKEVLVCYIEYVEGKTDIDEVPMSFIFWAASEIHFNSPISKQFR